MLNFLWWFVAGPIVGWIAGRVLRTGGTGLIDALTGLIGAFVVGTICELAGVEASSSPLMAVLFGAAGALIVTLLFRKVMARSHATRTAKGPSARSYTSYSSRMKR